MAHSIGHRSIALFNISTLPEQARIKHPQSLTIDDLSTSQRQIADNRDLVAVMHGNKTTILAPTGNVPAAVKGVMEEKENQGI